MKTKTLTILAGAAMLSFASCTNDMQELDAGQLQPLKQIVMTTSDFQPEADSRTLYQIADGAVKCTWAAKDTVGVFPDEGAQAYFPMKSGEGAKNATFTGGGWALKDGSTYGAYYPFIADILLDRNAVPVSYAGQKQTGNGSMAHLGDYDYMVATPTAPEFGSANFMFKHMSALVQLKLTIPEPATLASVKLVADTEAFAVKGKVDIMAETPGITTVTPTKEIKLDLQDVKTTEANQVVTLYMMLPPTELDAQSLKAVIASDKGKQEIALESKNFQAGKAYALSGSPESGEIVGDGSYKNGVVSLAEAGTMKKLLGKDYLSITSLKVVGPINGDDVYYLRKMLGGSNFSQADWGKLETLDLSDARIVEGGEWYLSNYYTANDEIGEHMFSNCANLKEIVLPDGVTSIGYSAFEDCDALTSIAICDGVTSMDSSVFYDCDALTTVTIGDGVASIGVRAFSNCDALTTVTIGDGVTSIGKEAFRECYALTTITIGDGVTSIGNNAFQYCSALTSVYIKDLSAWCKITFSDSSPLYYGAKLYLGNKEMTELIIPEDITEIKEDAFYRCGSIVNVVIPDHVTAIGSFAFSGCDALTSVTIGDGVTAIGGNAFSRCDALTSVTIGDGVTTIGSSAFSSCDALTSIDIPDHVISIGSSAFSDSALTIVTIGDGVTSIGLRAFNNCYALTTLTIGDGVTSIDHEAFEYCSALTDLYCHATTPPLISFYSSYHSPAFPSYGDNTTLHVPARCGSAYKSSDWGSYFKNIVEMD